MNDIYIIIMHGYDGNGCAFVSVDSNYYAVYPSENEIEVFKKSIFFKKNCDDKRVELNVLKLNKN